VGKSVLCLVSMHAPQAGRPMEEKVEFYSALRKVVSDMRSNEKLVLCGDLNGHLGEEALGFEEVHGGHNFGNRNLGRELQLEFAETMNWHCHKHVISKG
jgi:exonuclease III